MSDCKKYQEMISSLMDGELSESERKALEAHMSGCSDCRSLYTAFLAVSEAVSGEVPPAPAGLHEKIMTGVKQGVKKPKRSLMVRLRPYAAAAACLVVIVAGVLVLRQSGARMSKSADSSSAESASTTSTEAKSAVSGSAIPETAADSSVAVEYTVAGDTEEPAEKAENEQAQPDFGVNAVEAEAGGAEEEYGNAATESPEPIVLDAVSCVLTTTVDGETVTETLNATDTRVWLSTLILSGDKYADQVDPSVISYTMDITRESGEVYTLYLYYGEGEQLLCTRNEDGSEAIEVSTLQDFAAYAEETEAGE